MATPFDRVKEPKSALSAAELQGLFERHDIQLRPRPGTLDAPKQLNPLMEIGECGALESRGRRFFVPCNFAILKTREKKKKETATAAYREAGTVFAGERVERPLGAPKKEDARKGIQPAFADGKRRKYWRDAVGGARLETAPWHSLRQLMLLRNIAIAGQTFAIAVVHEFFTVPSPLMALLSVAGLLVLFNLATTAWRLRQPRSVTDLEVFAQIVVDVGALTALLYLSGGATNPFVGMFLMPLTIAAARLPWTHALVVALLTAACYSLLISYHVPLPVPGPGSMEFLVVATWVNYLLCAALVAYLVLTVAGRLREQNRRLEEIRRSASGHEYLMRVGSLAAGAAHEIRSPLCTMAVLVEDMLAHDDRPTLKQNLRIMSDQIEACRRTLSELAPGVQGAVGNGSKEPAEKFVQDIVDRFRTLRPGVKLSFGLSGPQSPAMISAERDLGRAILNLLNNAADASPEAVAMNCSWDAEELRIQVEDLGPGIPPELGEAPGERLFTTKGESGTGIGLMLTRTAVLGAGGSLKLSNRPGGGARAEVVLPLEQAASDTDRTEFHRPAKGASPDPSLRADPGVAIEGWRT